MENEKTTRYDDYKNSDWYDSAAIESLNRQLANYTTDYETLKKQAEAEYAPAYTQEMDALKTRLAQQTLAAENQKQAVNRDYERQRRATDARYDQSAAALNNTLNARGLGRSSLTATQGAYLEGQRNQALNDIDRAETDDIAAINSRIAQLTEESARSRQTMAANYAQQLEKRINDLRNSNQSASVGLQLQIAALQQQGYEAYQNWLLKERAQTLDENEFQQKYELNEAKSGGSSRRSASQAKSAKQKTDETQEIKKNPLANLINSAANGIRTAVSGISGIAGKTSTKKSAVSAAKNKAKSRISTASRAKQ